MDDRRSCTCIHTNTQTRRSGHDAVPHATAPTNVEDGCWPRNQQERVRSTDGERKSDLTQKRLTVRQQLSDGCCRVPYVVGSTCSYSPFFTNYRLDGRSRRWCTYVRVSITGRKGMDADESLGRSSCSLYSVHPVHNFSPSRFTQR